MRWNQLILCTILSWGLGATVVCQAATIGPVVPYRSAADGGVFWGRTPYRLENFEKPDALATEFQLDCGQRVSRSFLSSDGVRLADSVDGDDGRLDGSGANGSSWYCPNESLTLTFLSPVRQASFVFTDADTKSTNIRVELFGTRNQLLASLDAGDLADDFLSGSTSEDRFVGLSADEPLSRVKISAVGGRGLEIDHVGFATLPEPSGGLVAMALCGLLGWIRRRR